MGSDDGDLRDARDLGAIIPAALDDAGLTPHEFRIYARIARRAGADGCFESASKMAKACRMKRDTVFDALGVLLDRGMIRRTARPGKSSVYTLTPQREWRPVPFGGPSPETGHIRVTSKGSHEVTTSQPEAGVEDPKHCIEAVEGFTQPLPYKAHAGHTLAPVLASWLEAEGFTRPEGRNGGQQWRWLVGSVDEALGVMHPRRNGIIIALLIERGVMAYGDDWDEQCSKIAARLVRLGSHPSIRLLAAIEAATSAGGGEHDGTPAAVMRYATALVNNPEWTPPVR